ncbi:MAG: DNA-binding protein [Vagococcus sp.]|uniref:DNA-binding protein n=1 Tax=Vagococcus sp. TaxID=1933889 RepID=UPI002FCCAD0A
MLGIGLWLATLKFSIGFLLAILIGVLTGKKGKGIFKRTLIICVSYLLIAFSIVYFTLPSQSLSSMLFYNLATFLLGMVINFFLFGTSSQVSSKGVGKRGKNIVFTLPSPIKKGMIVASLLLLIYFIIVPVTRILSVDEIYDTIPVKKVTETEELKSTKETPIAMSTKSARNKMQKMISSVPNYSAYELGTTTAQMINGEYVYVSALEYRGVWKWNRFKKVPGYFQISATDINAQPKFIEKEMKYVPSGYLWQDAERKIYAKSSQLARTGAVNLEIGDDGTPYYVQTLYKEYGISGKKRYDKFKVAVLNSESGETKVYDLKDAPTEIDAPLTSSIASSMNNYYGKYGKGWLNSLFSKDDVKQPTTNGIYSSGAVTPLMSKSGELLYFTDFTSDDEKQDSALGYSLINARTGVMEFYRDKKGMMDSDGAIAIAEKIYPEKKWEAKMPILYNIEGVPTWIISLLDTNGIFKGYVYISASDSDILVDGTDAEKTLQAFKVKLSLKGSNNKNVNKADLKKVEGKVTRVNKVVIDGSETASFMLEEDSQVYTISTSNNVYSMFLKEGDYVSFEANISTDNPISTIEDITIKNVTPNSK